MYYYIILAFVIMVVLVTYYMNGTKLGLPECYPRKRNGC